MHRLVLAAAHTLLLGCAVCGVARLAHGFQPAEDRCRAVLPERVNGVPPERLVYEHLLGQAKTALAERLERLERVTTPEQADAYRYQMRSLMLSTLGSFPERTPLNVQTVGSLFAQGFRVEKLIFESRPGFFVTACLYLPESSKPVPAVLVPCGHSENGKAAEAYQKACILLAKNGIAALCYDPIGQGERAQLLNAEGKQRHPSTLEHTLVGTSAIPLGWNTATFRIWDGLRALDVLSERPEVDRSRLGCTGNSGGGTLTSYLMALDGRIVCAAPSCYLTTFERLLSTIGPQDAEQNLFRQIYDGLDHADYCLIRAPRPTLICTATKDFFDINGSWQTYRQAKRFYGIYGLSERVSLVEANESHGFSRPLRQAMVQWMQRWLLHQDAPVVEDDFPIFSDAELQCTPDGQVLKLPGARSAWDLLQAEADAQRALAERGWEAAADEERRALVQKLTGIQTEFGGAEIQTAWSKEAGGLQVSGLTIQAGGRVPLPAVAWIPAEMPQDALLVLDPEGLTHAMLPGGVCDQATRDGQFVLAVDVSNSGELTGVPANEAWSDLVAPDWPDMFMAYLLGRSTMAMRAEDMLIAAEVAATLHLPPGRRRKVKLVASGPLAVSALHAAALAPDAFVHVELDGLLESWHAVAASAAHKQQLATVVHGALAQYDLPLLETLIPEGRLTVHGRVNPHGDPVTNAAP